MKRWIIRGILFCFILSFFPASSIYAGEDSVETGRPQSAKDENGVITPTDRQRWALFPVIASNPEMGLLLGAMAFYFFPVDVPGQQASTIDILAYGTTKNQSSFSLSPNIFIDSGKYRLNVKVSESVWEANYYALGNKSPDVSEKYSLTNQFASLTLEKRFFDSFALDFLGIYDNNNMKVKQGGMLETGNVSGTKNDKYAGLGLEGGYDTRDNTNAPNKGVVARYQYLKFDTEFGSDFDFSIQTWDFRYYRKTEWMKDSVIALAANIRRSQGDVPFRYLSSPDGTNILRGIENGRYRDNDMAALQSEYRFPFKGKFSGTVFVEGAQVARRISDMDINDFKISLGAGFRYALNPEQRFNVRADIAWVDKGIGIIINIREAF